MAKYVYPAVFTKEEAGYSVTFPDLESCYTSAPDLPQALEMAKDILCLTLYGYEEEGRAIPRASAPKAVKTTGDDFVSVVDCDTMFYRRYYRSKAVKKTLTVPEWLNDMAERENINFSLSLQNALKRELHISE